MMLVASILLGQSSDPIYRVVKKDSTALICKILFIRGKGLFVEKPNGQNEVILRKEIAYYQLIKEGVVEQDARDSCFIVRISGDTLRGTIKRILDYTNLDAGRQAEVNKTTTDPWPNDNLIFNHPVFGEKEISQAEISQLFVYGKEAEKSNYVTQKDDLGYAQLYRIIVDGKCQLLGRLETEYSTGGNPLATIEMALLSGGSKVQRYYTFYNSELIPITPENFKQKSKKVFEDCPMLMGKIEAHTRSYTMLRQIVTEFNQCLETKK